MIGEGDFLVENRGFLRTMNETRPVRAGCCLVTARDGQYSLGLVRKSARALLPFDMFAANVDRISGSLIHPNNAADRPSSQYCARPPSPEQRASIDKGRHSGLPRQIETRTAPIFGISNSDRESDIELTDRWERRRRTPKPRSSYSVGENEI